MKKLLKKILEILSRILPLWLYRLIFPRSLISFFFHAVSDENLPHIKHLYPPVSLEGFESALQYIKRNYNCVSYAEVDKHINQGAPLPKRALYLSFDDGFAECYSVVRPLLLKYEVPCTFFLVTDWIDNQSMFYRNKISLCIDAIGGLEREAAAMLFNSLRNVLNIPLNSDKEFKRWIRSLSNVDVDKIDMTCKMLGIDIVGLLQNNNYYLTTEQIQEMSADGFTIGCHTLSHPKLVRVSHAEMKLQIVNSAKIIQEITNAAVIPFSFPHSAHGIDRSVLADICKQNSLLGLFFDSKGIRTDEDFIVNRIWAEHAELRAEDQKIDTPKLLKDAYQDVFTRIRM